MAGDDGDDPENSWAAELVERYEQGETIVQLVDRYGVTYSKVRGVLLEAGVRLRPTGPVTPVAPPGLVDAYRGGASITQLAQRFGFSFGVTRRMLLQEGVDLRPRGGRH